MVFLRNPGASLDGFWVGSFGFRVEGSGCRV